MRGGEDVGSVHHLHEGRDGALVLPGHGSLAHTGCERAHQNRHTAGQLLVVCVSVCVCESRPSSAYRSVAVSIRSTTKHSL